MRPTQKNTHKKQRTFFRSKDFLQFLKNCVIRLETVDVVGFKGCLVLFEYLMKHYVMVSICERAQVKCQHLSLQRRLCYENFKLIGHVFC